ncbi:MAG: hypothetical protein ACYCOU_01870 [Sulfobacillus sp.]
MDMRGLANGVSNSVNPNVPVTIQASLGYTTGGAGMRQVPTYATAVAGFAQVQALTSEDLRHLDGLNIQGATFSIILRGPLNTALRPNAQGGDLVTLNGKTFLTVAVLEQWPLWTRAAIRLQDGN